MPTVLRQLTSTADVHLFQIPQRRPLSRRQCLCLVLYVSGTRRVLPVLHTQLIDVIDERLLPLDLVHPHLQTASDLAPVQYRLDRRFHLCHHPFFGLFLVA
jgi:hypothetical protein